MILLPGKRDVQPLGISGQIYNGPFGAPTLLWTPVNSTTFPPRYQNGFGTSVVGQVIAGSYTASSSQSTDLGAALVTSTVTFGVIAQSSQADSFFISSRSSTGTAGFELACGLGATPGAMGARSQSSGSILPTGTITGFNDGQFHHFTGRFTGPTLSFFADGRKATDATGATGSITSSQNLFIGKRGATFLTGGVALVYVFYRVLTDSEIFQLHQNPWSLFPPRKPQIYVNAPSGVTNATGGGADTFKPLTELATGLAGALAGTTDTLRALTETATGASGALTGAKDTLKPLTASATGAIADIGSGRDTLKPITATASGQLSDIGWGTDTLKHLTNLSGGTVSYSAGTTDTLRAFNEAATGLAGAITGAKDTLRALLTNAGGTVSSNLVVGGAAGTLRPLTDTATGRSGSVTGAVDTLRALQTQAFGAVGARGYSVDSLKALQAAASGLSGATPIAPPAPSGGAPAWWGYEGFDGTRRPWWYRDLKDKAEELERMKQLRIEMGILPKAEAKRIAKVVKEVDTFIEEVPTPATADAYIARADALTERINALVEHIEEEDDEEVIMEMAQFFFHHRKGSPTCLMH